MKRFVLSSTAAVYASSDAPLSEESPIDPANAYGFTKLAIEQALEWYRRIHGLHFAALRYFNACGALPGRGEAHQPESHLIPLVLKVALGQKASRAISSARITPPRMAPASVTTSTSPTWSRRTCWRWMRWSEHDRLVYNLGNGNGYSVREVIETARSVTGSPIPVDESAAPPGRCAHGWWPRSEKIRQRIGLDSPASRPDRYHHQRLGLAPHPSEWV